MLLLQEITDKAREVCDLIEMGCHQDAIYKLYEIEEKMMQLSAEIDDWAHAMRDDFRLFTEAREWMGRDHLLAIEKIEQAIESFEAINRVCLNDEAEKDLIPESAGAADAGHWLG